MLECVVNISEGIDADLVARLARRAGGDLLDVHSDPHHNRSVFTLLGTTAPRAVTELALESLDLSAHAGAHPRLGVVDVVPFVALEGSTRAEALQARDDFARWLSEAHGVPCFLYGEERTLPDVRRRAFTSLTPDLGPPTPHPTAGATAVGHRDVMVAFNVWVADLDLDGLRQAAARVRGAGIRALGLEVGPRRQVSMNLITPGTVGPDVAHDRVAAAVGALGGRVEGAELVGLVPRSVLEAIPAARWDELDLRADRTIEARRAARARR